MKKFLTTILAVIYLSVSSGMVMNIHYCMGKVNSVKLAVLPAASCMCGKPMSKKGCCRTEAKLVKLEDAQKAAYTDFTIKLPIAVLFTALNLLQTPSYNAQQIVLPQVHPPPLLSEQDTYLRNCVFRI